MNFVVKKQYTRGPAQVCAEFGSIQDAKLFIEKRMEEDALLRVKVIYQITEFDEVISEFDPDKIKVAPASDASEHSGSAKGSSASFRPTPLNMTPRPPGTPQKWMKDDEDEDKE